MLSPFGAATILALSMASVASAQELPDACDLTDEEQALQVAAVDRIVELGDMAVFEQPATTATIGGCGVWLLSVSPDGTVAGSRMVRGRPIGAYETVVGEWLATFRFTPQSGPWTAATAVRLTSDETVGEGP